MTVIYNIDLPSNFYLCIGQASDVSLRIDLNHLEEFYLWAYPSLHYSMMDSAGMIHKMVLLTESSKHSGDLSDLLNFAEMLACIIFLTLPTNIMQPYAGHILQNLRSHLNIANPLDG
jgi:hypothetical protein